MIDFDENLVRRVLSELVEVFDSSGLILHGNEVTSGKVQALGCERDGTLCRSTLTRERLWKVHQAISGLLCRKKCSGRALEKLIGHCTFCGLMNRMSLSRFHVVYKFIQRFYEHAGIMWQSVRDELKDAESFSWLTRLFFLFFFICFPILCCRRDHSVLFDGPTFLGNLLRASKSK